MRYLVDKKLRRKKVVEKGQEREKQWLDKLDDIKSEALITSLDELKYSYPFQFNSFRMLSLKNGTDRGATMFNGVSSEMNVTENEAEPSV